ncbi:MAG: hypothetical protein ABJB55_00365 [Actinomycetota bacterium]
MATIAGRTTGFAGSAASTGRAVVSRRSLAISSVTRGSASMLRYQSASTLLDNRYAPSSCAMNQISMRCGAPLVRPVVCR